jgi:hypothetical protein
MVRAGFARHDATGSRMRNGERRKGAHAMGYERERVKIGTVRMSYLMQPVGLDGREVNGGMSYANADSPERAREWALAVMKSDGPAGGLSKVTVSGRELRLGYQGWAQIKGGRTEYFEVTRADAGLPPVFLDRGKTRCWNTAVMDYFETVHAMMTDGSCQCGDPTRNTRP